MTTAGALPRDATVAVIGSGAMGAGIAQIAAQAGHPVRLFDTRMGTAEKARTTIAQTLQGLAAKGKLDSADAAASAARIVAVHALGDCVSAQLVVEAIVEDLAEKRALLRELEKIVPPQTILASNTSSLSVTAIAAGLRHPGRVAGMHFFNPVPLMKLVEIIAGLATDVATTDTLAATAVAWGKEPVHATSTPGFIVNRCARPFYGEALRLLAEGAADAATIDAVLRAAGGFRMGAFQLMDLIGNDVNFAVTRSVWEACYYDPRYAPSVLQQECVAPASSAARAAVDSTTTRPMRSRRGRRHSMRKRLPVPSSCTAMQVFSRRSSRALPAQASTCSGVPRSMHSPMARWPRAMRYWRFPTDARRPHARARQARGTSCSSISRSTIRRANDWPSPLRMDAPPVRSVLRQALCSAPGSPCRGSTMSPASRCCASSRRSPTRRRTP